MEEKSMTYKSYVRFLSQISSGEIAHVPYQDIPLVIEKGKEKNQWTLSAKVFIGEREIPTIIRESASKSGQFRWQTYGPFLQVDEEDHTVSLIQHVEGPLTYLPFRDLITAFTATASEWKDTFEDFTETII
jgi:hypothetical protein